MAVRDFDFDWVFSWLYVGHFGTESEVVAACSCVDDRLVIR